MHFFYDDGDKRNVKYWLKYWLLLWSLQQLLMQCSTVACWFWGLMMNFRLRFPNGISLTINVIRKLCNCYVFSFNKKTPTSVFLCFSSF